MFGWALRKLSVYCDSLYLSMAIEGLFEAGLGFNKEDITFFAFEKPFISYNQYQRLISCKSEYIVVIGHPVMLGFLLLLLPQSRVLFVSINEHLDGINSLIDSFIYDGGSDETVLGYINSYRTLVTEQERRVASLYFYGYSPHGISKITGFSVKKVYTVKNNLAKKFGATSDAFLYYFWQVLSKL